MKGIAGVLFIAVSVLVLATSAVPAESLSNQMDIDEKTISPGFQVVQFDGTTYKILTAGAFTLSFERVDNEHHRVFIIASEGEVLPFSSIYIQWNLFPPVCLELGLGGGSTYLLGTETGYAEK
jgi:hypothetical protein